MKIALKSITLLLCLVLTLATYGCQNAPQENPVPSNNPAFPGGNSTISGSGATAENTDPVNDVDTDFAQSSEDMFTDRDTRTTYSGGTIITFNGSSASASGNGVSINGNTVTITADGTYILRGTLENGSLLVNVPDTAKPQLVFDGVNIHNDLGAALCILEGDKIFITLTQGSENSLSSGDSFAAVGDENVDGALYSKQDITLNGAGSLSVSSPAGHGIVGKDDVVITGGSYTLTAASHGIDANDSVRIRNASLIVEAGKDGVHVENTEDTTRGFFYMESGTLNLDVDGDGIDASAYIQIEDGTLQITAGGGAQNGTQSSSGSMGGPGGMGGFGGMGWGSTSSSSSSASGTSTKGIKASGSILINGGTFTIDSADDAVHSNTSAVIRDGTLTLSTGDDGIHADEYLTISGGMIVILKSYEGLEALNIEICGGDITMTCSDDGINAAGGTDNSGTGGMFGGDQFGGRGGMGGPGGMGGGMSAGNGSILISGGSIYMNASGDGIDANGSLTISGGLVTVCGPTQGDTAVLDFDTTGVITGGTFIGTGAYMMAQTFTDSEQGVISLSVGNQAAGTALTLTDAQGKVMISYTPALSYAIVSTPEMVKGETYTISIGDNSGEFKAQ